MNARDLLNAYAEIPNMNVIPLPFTPESMAPLAFAALRAVLNLHRQHENGSLTCIECSEREDTYDDIPWPCPTVTAITTALEAS